MSQEAQAPPLAETDVRQDGFGITVQPRVGGPAAVGWRRRRADWALARQRRPWLRAFAAAGGVWTVIYAAYATLSVFVVLTAPSRLGDYYPRQTLTGAFHSWFQWDGDWYLKLATDGYVQAYAEGQERAAAFFPFYPLVIRGADYVLPGGPLVAAAIISSAAMLAALTVLFRLTERELSTEAARRTLWLLVAFPTAFFLAAPFPSGLFLLLAVGSVYAMRGGRWWTAAALACLATATRSAGLLLLLPMAYEYLRQRDFRLSRIRWNVVSFGLVPAGLGAFVLYCHLALGDALAFVHAQRFWNREFSLPWTALARSAETAWRSHLVRDPINALELGTVLVISIALVLSVVGPWKLRRDQLAIPLFGFAAVGLIVLFPSMRYPAEPLLSASRHMLEVFPAFMVLGLISSRPMFERAYFAIGLTLQGFLLMHYLHGGWVA
jgi:hypothetical protein